MTRVTLSLGLKSCAKSIYFRSSRNLATTLTLHFDERSTSKISFRHLIYYLRSGSQCLVNILVIQPWTAGVCRRIASRIIRVAPFFALPVLFLAAGCAAAISSEPTPTLTGVSSPPTAAATQYPGNEGADLTEPATSLPTPGLDPLGVPGLDTSIANVSLEEILFDTFGRTRARYVPLNEATGELILGLRDAIAPVYQPVYGGSADLPWLQDGDLVIGYATGEEAYAYPINVLNQHELVNDVIDGVPVLISYCPLCASGITFHRELDGQTLLFGNTSALYQSDLVMYDHQTGSYWFQTAGEAVVGWLTGSRLRLLPSATMAWGEWKGLYPNTRLLIGTASNPTRFASPRYSGDPFSGYQDRVNDNNFIFPVDQAKLDDRLPSGELVLTVEVEGGVTAYPLDRIGDDTVNDQVGGQPVVVFSRKNSQAVGAFSPIVDGQTLFFEYRAEDALSSDRQTGSGWDARGRAISGPLAGTQLQRLDTRRAFWFSIVIAFPGVNLYLP